MSVCLSLNISLLSTLSACLSVCLSISVCSLPCLPVCVSVSQYLSALYPVCLSVCLSQYLSALYPVCLSVCLPLDRFLSLYSCVFVCLSLTEKLFIDSMFYDDPTHKYPTVEEQISLARRVAMSVLSPANAQSRGHKMFIKKRAHAARFTTGATDEDIAAAACEAPADPHRARPEAPGDVGGLPASIVFVPKLPTSGDKERLDAMSMDEIDRMQLAQKKMTHTAGFPSDVFQSGG